MTKWFDTNYHYLVPEFTADQAFRLASTKAVAGISRGKKRRAIETAACSARARSATCCSARRRGADFEPLSLLPRLLPVYAETLRLLSEAGCVMGSDRRGRVSFLDLSEDPRALRLARPMRQLTKGAGGAQKLC